MSREKGVGRHILHGETSSRTVGKWVEGVAAVGGEFGVGWSIFGGGGGGGGHPAFWEEFVCAAEVALTAVDGAVGKG